MRVENEILMTNNGCSLQRDLILEYLRAYRIVNGTFYLIKVSLENQDFKPMLVAPKCPVCKSTMNSSKLKNFWSKDAEVDEDVTGIKATSRLFFDSITVPWSLKRKIEEEINDLTAEEVKSEQGDMLTDKKDENIEKDKQDKDKDKDKEEHGKEENGNVKRYAKSAINPTYGIKGIFGSENKRS